MRALSENQSPLSDKAEDVRTSLRRVPRGMWGYISWVVGTPIDPDAKRSWTPSPGTFLVWSLLLLAVGVGLSLAVLQASPLFWILLPVGWLLATSGMRSLYVVVEHHAVHDNFFRHRGSARWGYERALHRLLKHECVDQKQCAAFDRRLNRWLGDAISILLLVSPFDKFMEEHRGKGKHHSENLAHLGDPDLELQLSLGFAPGMRREQLRRRLWLELPLSLKFFHGSYVQSRLSANFVEAAKGHRIMAATFSAVLLGSVAASGAWIPCMIAWIVPCMFLYNVSALWQFASEHRWLAIADPNDSRVITMRKLTFARFLAEATPEPGDHLAWARWWTRHFLIFLPARLFIFVGDLVNHDRHHGEAFSEWWDAGHERFQFMATATDARTEGYTEEWGTPRAFAEHGIVALADIPPWHYQLPRKPLRSQLSGM